MTDSRQPPQSKEEYDECEARWDESDDQERTIRIPFSEGVKLGFALAIGFLIAYVIILLTVFLLFRATLTTPLGN